MYDLKEFQICACREGVRKWRKRGFKGAWWLFWGSGRVIVGRVAVKGVSGYVLEFIGRGAVEERPDAGEYIGLRG